MLKLEHTLQAVPMLPGPRILTAAVSKSRPGGNTGSLKKSEHNGNETLTGYEMHHVV